MAYLRTADAERVRQRFERDLENDVDVVLISKPPSGLFVPGREVAATTRQAEALLSEVVGLSERVHLTVINPALEPKRAEEFGMELDPAIAVMARREGPNQENAGSDARVRMYGIPSGYEFMTLLDTITAASQATPRLAPETIAALGRLTDPVHIQVFVTPT